jgi:hypothetical protein
MKIVSAVNFYYTASLLAEERFSIRGEKTFFHPERNRIAAWSLPS